MQKGGFEESLGGKETLGAIFIFVSSENLTGVFGVFKM